MKFLRYGPIGQEKPCCLDQNGRIRDLSEYVSDFGGETVSIETFKRLARVDLDSLPIMTSGGRYGSIVNDTPDFLAIGRNYAEHVKETGSDLPSEPMLFSKASSCLSGPNDDVMRPFESKAMDWEVELGVVIGREAKNVSLEDAIDYVAGYCVMNDVSERAFQKERGGQFIKGKSAPTFGPVGPFLVTPDEINDPQNLALTLSVNGEVQQNSNTAHMIFKIGFLISHLSHFMTLRIGTLLATGTPAGVGFGHKPPKYLNDGDVMEVTVEGLGTQRQTVIS